VANDTRTIWKRKESKKGKDFLLLARAISTDWLASTVRTQLVFFQGDLRLALCDLRDAAKASKKKNLPIASLRLMLQSAMEGVIGVEYQLGLATDGSTQAFELMDLQATEAALLEKIAEVVLSWCTNVLEPWAQSNEMGSMATRVRRSVRVECFGVSSAMRALKGDTLNFTLISRLMAEQLSGQVLFEGMGPCEMVLSSTPGVKSVELMSAPRKPLSEAGGKNFFSMAAKIHISTAPYTDAVFLSLSAAKRVWANKMPDGKNTGDTATAYVIADDARCIPVPVIRTKTPDGYKWRFSDEYACLVMDSQGQLPATLEEALALGPYVTGSWWVGLPQLTRLYRRVDQHSVMESDEVDLLETVVPMLGGIVQSTPLSASRKLVINKKPQQAMLKLEDVGAAGVSLMESDGADDAQDADWEDEEEEGAAQQELDLVLEPQKDSQNDSTKNAQKDPAKSAGAITVREKKVLADFRSQCVSVLKAANASQDAALWIIGGTPREQSIIQKTAQVLFGASVSTRMDPLPPNVHGARSILPGKELKSRQRFQLRVQAWSDSGLAHAIGAHAGPKYVMICAAKDAGRNSDDSVNRRAAIHAICSMAQASVHHLLPMEEASTPVRQDKAAQAFIHRAQSAMMDVMLAHSGYVIGAGAFVQGQMDSGNAPQFIYGVQALRMNAQRYSGETPVCMAVYSRLVLHSNITELSFAYADATGTHRTDWMKLSVALIWLGSQRTIASNEDWLRTHFQNQTIAVLNEAQTLDARAVVLVDWGTLPSLWKDLRDSDLTNHPVKIGHIDIATAFPLMSFVRLRYGKAAEIALRSWSRVAYEGYLEGATLKSTGELHEDEYAGTIKQLVEMVPTHKKEGRAHFVGVMGPRKTFQIKRGKSCYRFMPRMTVIGASKDDALEDGKTSDRVFLQSTVEPLDKDASVPSSMDITVFHAPADVDPTTLATLAMGLRVGYAHYDDWTMLPAPLFFIRKIDDYIIKYPASEEEEGLQAVNAVVQTGGAFDEQERALAVTQDTPQIEDIQDTEDALDTQEALPADTPLTKLDLVAQVVSSEVLQRPVLLRQSLAAPPMQTPNSPPFARRMDLNLPQAVFSAVLGVGHILSDMVRDSAPQSPAAKAPEPLSLEEILSAQTSAPQEKTLPDQVTSSAMNADTSSPEAWQIFDQLLDLMKQRAHMERAHELLATKQYCDSLLRIAKNMDVVSLYPAVDQRMRRMYSMMVRGEIKVVVEVPYFVNLKGFFGSYSPEMKGSFQIAFGRMQKFGFVPPNMQRPSQSEFLDWLANKLRSPQAAYTIDARILFHRDFIFPQVAQIVKDATGTNATMSTFETEGGKISIDLSDVVKTLQDNNDDESLAWIVFSAAQAPAFDFAKTVVGAIEKIPGPKTLASLLYYMQCHSAVTQLIRDFSKKKNVAPIYHGLALPAPPELIEQDAQYQEAPESAGMTIVDAVVVEVVALPVTNQVNNNEAKTLIMINSRGDGFMKIKNKISEILETIAPGNDAFTPMLQSIRDLLVQMEALDADERLLKNSQAALQTFEAEVLRMLSDVYRLDEDGTIAKYRYKAIQSDELTRATTSLREVELFIQGASKAAQKMHDFMDAAEKIKMTRSEQVKHAQEVTAMSGILDDALDVVAKMLAQCFYLQSADAHAPLPGGPGEHDEATAPAQVAQAEVPDTLSLGASGQAAASSVPVAQASSGAVQEAEIVVCDTYEDPVAPSAEPVQRAVALAAQTVVAGTGAKAESFKQEESVRNAPLAVAQAQPLSPGQSQTKTTPLTLHKSAAPAKKVDTAPKTADVVSAQAPGTQDAQALEPRVAAVPAQALQEVPQAVMEVPVVSQEASLTSPLTPEPLKLVAEAAPSSVAYGVDASAISPEREERLQDAYRQLKALVDVRNYGLGGLYNQAIAQVFDDESVKEHAVILGALVQTLDAIDCDFSIDSKLPIDFREKLLESPGLCGRYATNVGRHIGVLGAGFVSALFSNSASGATADAALWLVLEAVRQPLTGLTAVSALLDQLVSMDTKGILINREKMASSNIGGMVAVKSQQERERKRAENWRRDHALHTTFNHRGFDRMHDYIYSLRHPIGQCVGYIAKGDIKSLRSAFDSALTKFKKPQATIIEAYRSVGERGKPDGKYAVLACENITATEKFIRDFIALQGTAAATTPASLPHDVSHLNELHARMIDAITEVSSLDTGHLVDAIYMKATATVMQSVLRLFSDSEPAACIPVAKQKLLLPLPMDRTLTPSMFTDEQTGEKAVCSGEEVMQAIDEVVHEEFQDFNEVLTESQIEALLVSAQRAHIEEGRFIPAFSIDAMLRTQSRLDPPIMVQFQKAKAELTQRLQDARQRVTHAMALSALDQKDANRLLNIIAGIHTSNMTEKSIGQPEGASVAYPDFAHAKAALQNQVLKVLDAKLNEARDNLLREVNGYQATYGDAIESDVKRIRTMLESDSPSAIRTAYDACAVLRGGGALPSHIFDAKEIAPKDFNNFLTSVHPLRGRLVLVDALQQALLDPVDEKTLPIIRSLDDEQRKEASAFLQAWKDLCMSRGSDAADQAGAFFGSMGIGVPSFMPESTRRNAISKFQFPDSAFSGFVNTDCFIPPALGSQSRLVCGYVVPGNQPEGEISALIQDVSGVPTFILSRAALTLTRRARQSAQAPVILVDDNLVCYMALHPDERAKRMMEIGTLTFFTHPYSAEGMFVPREMFFGRQREIQNLREVKSLAILYGGRRLGKSSLLAQIEREEGNVAGSTAIYIPMDRDYAGDDHVLFAWRKLYGALVSRSVIPEMAQSETDWRKIKDWVEAQLTSNKQSMRSCYLLFDEADNLMAHEIDLPSDKISFVRSLQQLSENVNQKFKLRYVIAGLHNLARMTTESNSAFGKAQVIALEPYNTNDDIMRGVQLVTKPMAALGFFFGEGCEDLPLRILSICNFYPAFIQIYCRKLLDHMYNKRASREAFDYVTEADLEAVEKDHDLLHELQEKYSWTLDLTKKYKCIGLILADCYYAEIENGKNDGLTVGDIREYCEVAAPNHFQGLSGGAYEGLLDEMRKLNVLEKNGSRYRLRNPSIAMLIGDRKKIAFLLDVLSKMPPEVARNHGDRRNELISIGKEMAGKAPIFPMPVAWTYAQMETIDGSLVVIGGNNLSGLVEISTLNQDWQLGQNDVYQALNLPASSVSMQVSRIRKQATHHGSHAPAVPRLSKGSKLLLVSTPTSWRAQEIVQFSALASKAASSQVRLGLLATPDKLFEVSKALAAGAIPMPGGAERKVDWSMASIPAWSVDALRFYLPDNLAVTENPEACAAILRASCGFGREIQNICAGRLTVEKALGLPANAKKNLFANRDHFYSRIGWPKDVTLELRTKMESFLFEVNGKERGSAEVDELLVQFGLLTFDMLFLSWMGLLQEGPVNTWMVPEMYWEMLGE
jgi:AAA+ ATPase superfamily predicted ATPase